MCITPASKVRQSFKTYSFAHVNNFYPLQSEGKMKKRLYVLLALGGMTTVLLTACGSTVGNTTSVATESSVATEADTTG